MNIRSLVKYVLRRDTTHRGEFGLMLKLAGRDTPSVIVDVGGQRRLLRLEFVPFVHRNWRALLIEPHPCAVCKAAKIARWQGECHLPECGVLPTRPGLCPCGWERMATLERWPHCARTITHTFKRYARIKMFT